MQKPCQDSYYTLFSSYPTLLDYHEEQAKNSRWIRCKVADLQVEPLGESSPLIGNLSAFAAFAENTVRCIFRVYSLEGNLI